MIADRVRRPVKLVWTREDDIRNGQYRNASLTQLQVHFDEQGKVRRWFQKAVQTAPDDPKKVASLGDGMVVETAWRDEMIFQSRKSGARSIAEE